MGEGNLTLWAAFISALAAIGVSIVSLFSTRNKNSAEANATTSGEWQKLYDEMSGRVDKLERQLEEMKDDNRLLEKSLRDLWDGNRMNVIQIRELGHEPRFEPAGLSFRGDDSEV